ncbi:MAG: ATP-binding protein [Bacteroidota bacterium]|nr:ATP-binding protein [Bacteroidota bacterium]
MLKTALTYYLSFAKSVGRYLWSDSAMLARKWYVKFAFSIILLALTTYIKLHFNHLLGRETPFLLYFAVVILSTGFGGIGPGIFATIVSALLCDYYFLSPFSSLTLSHSHAEQVITFVLECLLLISLSGAVTRANRTVRRSGERFKALLENSTDAIIVVNEKGDILFASPTTEKVVGYTAREVKKMNIREKIHKDDEELLKKAFAFVLQSPGNTQTILHRYLLKNGSWAWLESTITNLTDHPGIMGMVSNFRNVTEKILLEKQKDDFIGVATHELKTPVTSIKAYAQILSGRFRKEGNIASAVMVEKMDVQLNKLIGLISDLLDVTKIEGGRLHFQESFYDLNELVKEVTEELQHITITHEIVLKLDESEKIFGDRERVAQVLTNLISNAIKYSPVSKTINVITTLQKNNVRICVEDQGLGISEKYKDKVFERFYRVSGPDSHTFPGIGLGLYISSEIVKRQGGRIWVESKEGKGSTFCFELPYNYQDSAEGHNHQTKNTGKI